MKIDPSFIVAMIWIIAAVILIAARICASMVVSKEPCYPRFIRWRDKETFRAPKKIGRRFNVDASSCGVNIELVTRRHELKVSVKKRSD